MDILIQLASPILTAFITLRGARLAFSNRLTALQTKAGESKQEEQPNERLAVIETKVDALTDEVRKHNGVLEKHYALEARVSALQKR